MNNGGVIDPKFRSVGQLSNLFFNYDHTIRAMNRMQEFYLLSQASNTADIMVLFGASGSGKTKIAKRFYSQIVSMAECGGSHLRAIYLSVPSKCTPKSLAADLLEALGDPHADRGTLPNMTRRVITYIEELGVSIVILDEFQHFVNSANEKVIYDAADWLKSITNHVNCPFLLVGLPSTLKVLSANEQLARRMTDQVQLDAMPYETDVDVKRFRTILALFAKELPFANADCIVHPDFSRSIQNATQGLIGRVVRLLRAACALALREGVGELTLDIFARAYDELSISLQADQTARKYGNPFKSKSARTGKVLHRELPLAVRASQAL